MSIDARVSRVFRDSDGTGDLFLVDRPKSRPEDNDGCCGQPQLSFDESPEGVMRLEGKDVWGSSEDLMLGDVKIADRSGYCSIGFVLDDEEFNRAVAKYEEKRKP